MMTVRLRDVLAGWLVERLRLLAQGDEGFVWDRRSARYRDRETGRYVAESRVLGAVEHYGEYSANNIGRLTERLNGGQLTIGQWQREVAQELKNAHLIAAMAGRGGRDAMTQADWGRVGGRLRWEYEYLNRFAQEIEAGKLSAAQIAARARLYGNAARKSYYDGRTAAARVSEYRYEQRFLQPGESCEDCVNYAARGRVPIGTLPEPGEGSRCRSNCNCIKRYYTEEEAQAEDKEDVIE